MPYRHAHLAVWFLIGLTVVAFWPGYLSRLGRSQWQHHFHGLTALAWMLLLIAQSMLIDRRDRARHRWLGRAMLGLVPLFCAGGFLVVQTMLQRTDVFRATMGDRLMWVDGLSTVTFAFLCHQALAHRRNPALHGGYLLATPLPLIMAVVTRLPLGLVAKGTPLPAAFQPAFDLSMVIILACVSPCGGGSRAVRHPSSPSAWRPCSSGSDTISRPRFPAGRLSAWPSPPRPPGWWAAWASPWGRQRWASAGWPPFAFAPWLEPLPETRPHVRLRADHVRRDLPACGATPSSAPASSVARAVTCVRSSRPTASHVACEGTSAATRPRHRLEVR